MKKLALIIPAISIALASCGVAGPTMSSYTLSRPATVQSLAPTYSPAGTVSIGQVPGVTRTTITLTGLAPYAIYTARYFTPGTGATTTTTTSTATAAPAGAAASTTVTNPATATAGTSAGGAIAGGALAQTQATGTTSTTDMAAVGTMTTTTTVATSGSVCSGGMAIATSRLTGQADKDGKLSLDGFIPTAALSGAAYLNVQGASDFAGTPSDSGVLCTAVSLN
ncbi:hypothetical protein [Deinococcus gobiensis]|uniref:Lipoprotein n=1 Tax=Deinococcus gobiensis (strain DSM 21396 / JCM 16679 / CGMCC 1.7299 / I-0) TaxID=745776 RepID=H8GYV6_DEIGI|nr:hypothetical protein [Deinococcus gobiensis]AFD24883.1 hypothetical protein DGo_CA0956 [Deinococcus gobiensis I-0]